MQPTECMQGRKCIITQSFNKSVDISSANHTRLRGDMNVTIESSVNETVCSEELVNLTCLTDQQVKDVTWHWSDQSKQGSHITIRATPNKVVYICEATSDKGETGKANITIVANGKYLLLQELMLTHANYIGNTVIMCILASFHIQELYVASYSQ